jgi:hypothetical protein
MALVRTDVSEERSTYIIRVTRIVEVGTTLAITNNRHMMLRNTISHGIISQKMEYFIVTAVKPRILHRLSMFEKRMMRGILGSGDGKGGERCIMRSCVICALSQV